MTPRAAKLRYLQSSDNSDTEMHAHHSCYDVRVIFGHRTHDLQAALLSLILSLSEREREGSGLPREHATCAGVSGRGSVTGCGVGAGRKREGVSE